MITFETQEDFENAVLQVLIDNLRLDVYTRGHPFVTGVEVSISNVKDYSGNLLHGSDAVS